MAGSRESGLPPGARTSLFAPELDRLFVAASADTRDSGAVLVFRPVA